tara:strand:+ start:311 stop:475 length:165 start_codon:yes stop_codon:yes gene_type:complete
MPKAKNIDNNELPPRLNKGRVTPTTGRSPIAIETFVIINRTNIHVMLPAKIFEK